MVEDPTPLDIAQVVAEHHQAVYRYAYRLTGSVQDAEDLTQQVFLAAHQKLEHLRSPGSVRSWLFVIVRNSFLTDCQKRRPVAVDPLGLDMNTVPAEIPDRGEIDPERLQLALDELLPDFRVVLVMFYFEGCSYREIADRLEVPIGTVMSRLARAKAFLRSKLLPASSGTAGAAHHATDHGG